VPEPVSAVTRPAPSLPAPSLPAPSLPAPSLPAPSLPAPSLPARVTGSVIVVGSGSDGGRLARL
jgi:2-methylisoborneol synthase